MKKSIKTALVLAAILTACGLLLGTVGLMLGHFDLTALSTVKYRSEAWDIDGEFGNISMQVGIADVEFLPSEDEGCHLSYTAPEGLSYTWSVQNNTLTVTQTDARAFWQYIGLGFGQTKMTLYLPKTCYTSLFVKTGAGSVTVPDTFCFDRIQIAGGTGEVNCAASAKDTIDIQVGTGEINLKQLSASKIILVSGTGAMTLEKISCDTLQATSGTGEVSLCRVSAKELIRVKGNTGDICLTDTLSLGNMELEGGTAEVVLVRCDSEQINIRTGTGSVSGSLLSEKVFVTETGTGHISVPSSTSGGPCRVTTGTGSIHFTILP